MAVYITDEQIEGYIREPKRLPKNWRKRMDLKEKRGHREREIDVDGATGGKYRLILRQGIINPLDFSVILGIYPPGLNRIFRLRRYNGKHEHTNKLEGSTFDRCHIHQATERYQNYGAREDAYAEPTDRYADYHAAVQCMWIDCGFDLPDNLQWDLFEEVRP